MDEQDLVLVVVDDAGKFGAAPNQVARGELALEYGVLQMIAVPAHGLEDFAEPLVVSDVVTNQIRLAHCKARKATPTFRDYLTNGTMISASRANVN
jgi:hypothetical protein